MRIELLAKPEQAAGDLREILLLVGEDVPVERITRWAPLERCLVADWATRQYLTASDNNVRSRPRPSLLDASGPVQNVRAGRDASVAGCNMVIHREY